MRSHADMLPQIFRQPVQRAVSLRLAKSLEARDAINTTTCMGAARCAVEAANRGPIVRIVRRWAHVGRVLAVQSPSR